MDLGRGGGGGDSGYIGPAAATWTPTGAEYCHQMMTQTNDDVEIQVVSTVYTLSMGLFSGEMVDSSNMPHPKCLGSQKNPGTEPKTCERGPKLRFEYLPTSKTSHCVRTACMAFPYSRKTAFGKNQVVLPSASPPHASNAHGNGPRAVPYIGIVQVVPGGGGDFRPQQHEGSSFYGAFGSSP